MSWLEMALIAIWILASFIYLLGSIAPIITGQ